MEIRFEYSFKVLIINILYSITTKTYHSMNKLIVVLVLLSNVVFAQTETNNWFTDFEKAKTYAAANDSEILMVFAGSDWCKPCIKFKKTILASDTFKAYAKKNVTILYLDFPSRRKNKLSKEQTKHNEALAEKYNRQGFFPNIVLMDSKGKVLAKPQFKGQSPTTYIAHLKKVKR